jgi:hypothetical protein
METSPSSADWLGGETRESYSREGAAQDYEYLERMDSRGLWHSDDRLEKHYFKKMARADARAFGA